MGNKFYVRQREVNQKMSDYTDKTKFVIDTLIDIKNNTGGATVNENVIKEVCKHLYNYTHKKKLQVEDSIRYRYEVKEEEIKPEENINLQLSFIE